jgi:hypothetical protein
MNTKHNSTHEQASKTFDDEFQPRILDQSEMSLVSGGLRPADGGCGTSGTKSVCHVDGTDDPA